RPRQTPAPPMTGASCTSGPAPRKSPLAARLRLGSVTAAAVRPWRADSVRQARPPAPHGGPYVDASAPQTPLPDPIARQVAYVPEITAILNAWPAGTPKNSVEFAASLFCDGVDVGLLPKAT